MKPRVALTIAASDPTGATGLQADLTVFARHKVVGAGVVTALGIQNTQAVDELVRVPAELVRKQLATLLEDLPVAAVKTGPGLGPDMIEMIAELLRRYKLERFVLDASFRTAASFILVNKDDVALIKKTLVPLALVVTANWREVEALTGVTLQSEKDMLKAAEEICGAGARHAVIWGGEPVSRRQAVDLFYDGRRPTYLRRPMLSDRRILGAGGLFSAALTAGLAQGAAPLTAARRAKLLVQRAISRATALGKGRQTLDLVR